jgi:hypothetical protein
MLRRNKLSSPSLSSLPTSQQSSISSSGNSSSSSSSSQIDIEANNNTVTINSNSDSDSNMKNTIPAPPRSESMAYASHSPGSALLAKINYYLRYNTKAIVVGIGMILVVLVMIADNADDKSTYLRL